MWMVVQRRKGKKQFERFLALEDYFFVTNDPTFPDFEEALRKMV